MNKSRRIYLIINTLLLLGIIKISINGLQRFSLTISNKLLVFMLIFGLYLIVDMCKVYFIFLEKKMNLSRFLAQYIKYSFYRIYGAFSIPIEMYLMGYEGSSYKSGIIGVLFERIIGSMASLVLASINFFLFQTMTTGFFFDFSILIIILLVFCVAYFSVEYTNKFLVLNTQSKLTPKLLKVIDLFENWLVELMNVIHGKFAIIMTLSIASTALLAVSNYFVLKWNLKPEPLILLVFIYLLAIYYLRQLLSVIHRKESK